MSIEEQLAVAGMKAFELGVAISEGRLLDALKAARALEDDLVMLIPPELLKEDLTDSDRRFADLGADVAEATKLENEGR